MQKSEQEHNNMLSRMQHDEKIAQENKERELELAAQHSNNEEQLVFLTKLKGVGVDLTQYLVSQVIFLMKYN